MSEGVTVDINQMKMGAEGETHSHPSPGPTTNSSRLAVKSSEQRCELRSGGCVIWFRKVGAKRMGSGWGWGVGERGQCIQVALLVLVCG